MFFVFNKNKIYSYLIAVCTVVMLFFIASVISNDQFNSVETSSTIIENTVYKGDNEIEENIVNKEEINQIIFDKKAK